jgi:hypothetical protein
MKIFRPLARLKSLFFILVLIISAVLGQQIISLSLKNQEQKQDFAEISHIKYGLFSINQWKQQMSTIITTEISGLDIRDNEKQLRPLIHAQLNDLIDNVDKKIRTKNSKTFKGNMKQSFLDAFVDVQDIKAGIPQYTESLLKLMEKPKTKKSIKGLLLGKVEEYFDKTFEEQDLTPVNQIVAKTKAAGIGEAKLMLERNIKATANRISILSFSLIGLAILLFAWAGFSAGPLTSSNYVTLTLMLLILLVAGVTTPMIDLEAKISEMSFVLFDHPVKFLNQVLYFQTKSVLDVFWIMVTNPEPQMKVVGILIVTFSVIFPVLKLISAIGYFYNIRKARENKWVRFFVLKSGKWSMTDVMIIAIFMAYIGFNGILASQLGKLHAADQEMVLLTTNGTSLQPGFYLFSGYAIMALFLSEFLSRKVVLSKPKTILKESTQSLPSMNPSPA